MWCSRCKNTFAGAGNLQMITNKFWCEYLCTVSGFQLAYSFNFLRSWSIKPLELITWKRTSLLTRLVCVPQPIAALYYMKFTCLWRGDELSVVNFWDKWKQPATKISSKIFFSKKCKSIFYVSAVNCYCTHIFKGCNCISNSYFDKASVITCK